MLTLRLVDLASGLVVLTNESHVHPAYATTRAIVETAAVPAWANQELPGRLQKKRVDQVDLFLMRLVMGIDKGLLRPHPKVSPIEVSNLIDALSMKFSEIAREQGNSDPAGAAEVLRTNYRVITDATHPNSTALHVTTRQRDDGGRTWSRTEDVMQDALEILLDSSILAMLTGRTALDELFSAAAKFPLLLIDHSDPTAEPSWLDLVPDEEPTA